MTGSHTIRAASPTIPRLVDLRAYDAEGMGHILPARTETRHPCGERVRPERFAHPATQRCPDCVGAIGLTVPAPTVSRGTPETQGELRESWGK